MMDPQQAAALNALAPFTALASSASSPRLAADVINRAVSAPSTYIFAELLQNPRVQALKGAESSHSDWLRILEIFAWGTWADYHTSTLPRLSSTAEHKLRLLTLLTLARTPEKLTYPALQSALDLVSAAALEALVTDAIYAQLLTAQLDPRAQRVLVSSVAPLRDVAPGQVVMLTSVLEVWERRCATVLTHLDAQAHAVRKTAHDRQVARRDWERRFEEVSATTRSGKGRDDESTPSAATVPADRMTSPPAAGGGRGAKREGMEVGEGSRDAKRGARFLGRKLGT